MRATRKSLAAYPPADISIERVGDLIEYGLDDLTIAAGKVGSATE